MDDQLKLIKKINRRTRFTQFLAWLALFFTAIGIAAGSKHWFRIDDKTKSALKQIQEIKTEIPSFALQERVALLEKEINDNFKVNKAHLDKAMKELRTIQDSTQHIADSVFVQAETLTQQQPAIKIQTPTLKDWSLGEVHFLLQTAVQQFELKKDKDSAIASFKLADKLLLERGELELLPVRKKISEDIALVNQYITPDVSALSQRIDTLLKQLEPKIKTQDTSTSEIIDVLTLNDDSDKNDTNKKGTLVNRIKKTVNDAVVIRKLNKPLQNDLDTDSKERLFQLFSLRFETLRIMLFQSDDNNYQKQIERIRPLLISYYPIEKNKLYLEQLDGLSEIKLSPESPQVNNALQLLEKLMIEKNIATIPEKQDLKPSNQMEKSE